MMHGILLISFCIARAGGLQRAQRRVAPGDLGRRTPRAPPASRRIICSTGDCLEDHLASREGLLETRGGPRGARPSSRWSSCWQGARMGCGGRDHPAPAACVHAGGRRRARCRARSRDAVQPSSNFASQLPSLFRAFSLPFKSKIFHYLYYATEQNYDLPPKPTIEYTYVTHGRGWRTAGCFERRGAGQPQFAAPGECCARARLRMGGVQRGLCAHQECALWLHHLHGWQLCGCWRQARLTWHGCSQRRAAPGRLRPVGRAIAAQWAQRSSGAAAAAAAAAVTQSPCGKASSLGTWISW